MVVRLKRITLGLSVALALTGSLLASCAGDDYVPTKAAIAVTTTAPATTTSTAAPTTTAAPVRKAVERASRSSAGRVIAPSGDIWGALARCESGGRVDAVSRNGKYFGAFQFAIGTWHSVGGQGNPIDHDYATQLHFAQALQARSGWGQWPVCSRKLGLR